MPTEKEDKAYIYSIPVSLQHNYKPSSPRDSILGVASGVGGAGEVGLEYYGLAPVLEEQSAF